MMAAPMRKNLVAISICIVLGTLLVPGITGSSPCNAHTLAPYGATLMDAPVEEWNQTFGGESIDWGWWAQQTSDGGYVMTGETLSFSRGSFDAWLLKTDRRGNEEWNVTFGGRFKDGGRCLQQTSDGGYIIAGYADSYGFPGHDFWLIKTDSNGIEEWNNTYGGEGSDAGFFVRQTFDGGYIVTGYTGSYGKGSRDVWLLKTDSHGNMEWQTTLGGAEKEYGMAVNQTRDGGYILVGQTSSYGAGGYDLWLVPGGRRYHVIWCRRF